MYSVTWNTCPQRLLRVWNACDKFITSIALADTRRLVPLPLDEETLKHWSATTAVRLPRYNVGYKAKFMGIKKENQISSIRKIR